MLRSTLLPGVVWALAKPPQKDVVWSDRLCLTVLVGRSVAPHTDTTQTVSYLSCTYEPVFCFYVSLSKCKRPEFVMFYNLQARFHFLVLPTEAIANMKALTPDHIPLLRHLEEKGREIAAKWDCLLTPWKLIQSNLLNRYSQPYLIAWSICQRKWCNIPGYLIKQSVL